MANDGFEVESAGLAGVFAVLGEVNFGIKILLARDLLGDGLGLVVVHHDLRAEAVEAELQNRRDARKLLAAQQRLQTFEHVAERRVHVQADERRLLAVERVAEHGVVEVLDELGARRRFRVQRLLVEVAAQLGLHAVQGLLAVVLLHRVGELRVQLDELR